MIKQQIETALANVLQRDIHIICNNKTIKQGKLINYSINDYVITFTIRNNKKQLKSYDMYYPYDMQIDNDKILFDYTVDTLSSQNEQLLDLLRATRPVKTHKHFDSVVSIFQAIWRRYTMHL